MARLSLILIFVLGLSFLGFTSAIRWEMTFEGVSPFVAWLGVQVGVPDQTSFIELSHLHGMLGTLLFLLVASFLAFAKAQHNLRVARSIGFIAFAMAMIMLVFAVWEVAHVIWPEVVPNNPVEANHDTGHLNDHFSTVRWSLLIFSEEYFRTAALTLTIAAAACAVCINSAYRLGSLLLMALIIVAFVLFTYFYLSSHSELSWSFLLVPQVVLLAVLAIVMIDPNHADEPHLTMGVGLTLVAGLAFDLISSLTFGVSTDETYFDVANEHLSQHTLLIFAFFSAYFARFGDSVNPLRIWLHAAALSLALIVSYMPMMAIGQEGGMAGSIETGDKFGDLQQLTSFGFIGICVVVVWGLVMPWTSRLFDDRQPAKTISHHM